MEHQLHNRMIGRRQLQFRLLGITSTSAYSGTRVIKQGPFHKLC